MLENLASFPLAALSLGLILDVFNKKIDFLKIPNTILIFFFSLIASIIVHKFIPSAILDRFESNYTWESLEPESILAIVLPPMIFQSAFTLNSSIFFARIKLFFSLTVFVYISTLIVYALLLWPFTLADGLWSLKMVLLLSAILAATDPISVVAILEDMGAPQRIKLLLESESLINDAFSILAYHMLSGALLVEWNVSNSAESTSVLLKAINSILVSPFVGSICANIIVMIGENGHVDNKRIQMLLVLFLYILWQAVEYIGGSPAIAVVFFGLRLNNSRQNFEPNTVDMIMEVWSAFNYWANCIIFTFSGYSTGSLLFKNIELDPMRYIMAGIVLYPVSYLARMISLIFFKYTSIYLKMRAVDSTDFKLLLHGGLKGSLALLLAYDFGRRIDEKAILATSNADKIHLFTSSTVFTCLLVQGMTVSYFAKKYDYPPKYVREFEGNLEQHIKSNLMRGIEEIRRSGSSILSANWRIVYDWIDYKLFEHFQTKIDAVVPFCKIEILNQPQHDNLTTIDDSEDIRKIYYSILTEKAINNWSQGAISGSTAQMVIDLLEQGTSEGELTKNDFREMSKRTHLSMPERFILSITTKIKRWLNCDDWLSHFDGTSPPFYNSETEQSRTEVIFKPDRSKEWWSLFSTFLTTVQSVSLAIAMYRPLDLDIYYAICVISLLISTELLVDEIVVIHDVLQLKKENFVRKLSVSAAKVAQSRRNNFRYEFGAFISLQSIIINLGIFIILLAILHSHPRHSSEITFMSFEGKTYGLRSLLMVLSAILCITKILLTSVPAILTIQEALYCKNLRAIRTVLSVLYFLQQLLCQPPIPFYLLPNEALKIVENERKFILAAVESVLQESMHDDDALGVVRVINTRRAFRVAIVALQRTIKSMKTQGFIHEESEKHCSRALKELSEISERLIKVPLPNMEETLESIHWIHLLKSATKKNVIDKLIDFFNQTSVIDVGADNEIDVQDEFVFFIKKGTCRVTETPTHRQGIKHPHKFYVYQGGFIGEENMLKMEQDGSQLLKKPKINYHAITACKVIKITEEIQNALFSIDVNIVYAISKAEQARNIFYELRDAEELLKLTLIQSYARIFKRSGLIVNRKMSVKVRAGRKLILGWRIAIKLVEPIDALDDEYNIVGPAMAEIAPAHRDDGLAVLVNVETGGFIDVVDALPDLLLMHEP